MRFFPSLTGATLRVFVRELRDTRKVLQHGIDTYRQVHGLPLLFSEEDAAPAEVPAATGRRPIVQPGDMLTLDMLEALAADQGVKYWDLTELENIAYDRGWVDAGGKLLMIPEKYATAEFGQTGMLAHGG